MPVHLFFIKGGGTMDKKRNKPEKKIYAVYRGDEFVCIGTMSECVRLSGLTEASLRSYISRLRNDIEALPQDYHKTYFVFEVMDDDEATYATLSKIEHL